MEKSMLNEKYPIYSVEIPKTQTRLPDLDAVIEHIKEKIATAKTGRFIAVFDHYDHVRQLGGEINPEIKASKHVLFCLSNAIPAPGISALRPRAMAVNDLGDRFVIGFLEAPVPAANEAMQAWVASIYQA